MAHHLKRLEVQQLDSVDFDSVDKCPNQFGRLTLEGLLEVAPNSLVDLLPREMFEQVAVEVVDVAVLVSLVLLD
tara:strand:- start:179 stop:400 length:222 start_codon:yes stop_codon:yes gene_type:complete